MLKLKKKIKIVIILMLFTLPLYPQKEIDPARDAARGVQLGQQKRYDEALMEFDKAIKYYNNSAAKVYHNKGWALELKENIPEAISAYEEALKRNPDLIPSMERVGYLYFQTGKFEEAVSTGERVIRLDPKNQEVIKWLPKAYLMKIQKQRETLMAKQGDGKNKNDGKNLADAAQAQEEKKEQEPPPRYIYATLDFMIRTAYYFRDGEEKKGYMYKATPGYYTNVPEMVNINATPTRTFEIDLEAGRPYLGALSPSLIIHTEKLEAIAHLGKYSLGIGAMGNHYRSSFAYPDGKTRKLHDIKAGFIFGFAEDDARLLFRLYPRALPHDGEQSSGKTFDTDYAKLDYEYKIDKMLSFYSWMSARDYYYFDHEAKTSSYWGVYELGFGISVEKSKGSSRHLSPLSVSIDFTERFYMRDLNNDKPYKFANGQGWFGANADKWFEGNPFSGYRAPGHVFTVKVQEGITNNIFLYQKIIIEMVDRREDHDEYSLMLGVGGVY